jgi:type III pantothenate kinase
VSCLLIDRGNTATKWRFRDATGRKLEGRDYDPSLPDLESALRASGQNINEVWVSSVGDNDGDRLLKDKLRLWLGSDVSVNYAKVSDHFRGLSLSYSDVATLGVDRWLMMLAAKERFELPLVIISAGTALTFDKISKDGHHLGGLIAPGWATLSSSLGGATAKLGREISLLNLDDCALGQSTQLCLDSAVSRMFLDYIKSIDRQFAHDCQSKLLCGGDADAVAAAAPLNYTKQESLVLDGLALLSS